MQVSCLLRGLVVYAVFFLILGFLLYSATWMALACLILYVIVFCKTLVRFWRVGRAALAIVRNPNPGQWDNFYDLAVAVGHSGQYRIVEHGEWPTEPVIFVVNYPNEVLEYTFIGWAANKSPVSVIANRGIQNATFWRSPLTWLRDCKLKENVNFIVHEESLRNDAREGAQTQTTSSLQRIEQQIQQHTKVGRSIWIYPERQPQCGRKGYSIRPLRTGAFVMAEHLQIPIVPLVFGHLALGRTDLPMWIGKPMRASATQTLSYAKQFFDQMMQRMSTLDNGI